MATARPTVVSGLALLVLIPVVVFLLDRSAMVVSLSVVSVLIIAWSLYSMFGPTADHGADVDGNERSSIVE